ncbi:MAG TPA: hypothetical protein VFP11_13315 [Candidatus Angelobacter sp.]|nr:hypothetical protein [Candidatus Angelobacter sp.]
MYAMTLQLISFSSAGMPMKAVAGLLLFMLFLLPASCRHEHAEHYPPSDNPVFPWPPPRASATVVLPRDLLQKDSAPRALADVNARLIAALGTNGYMERSYYSAPDGFALVTRLEQIEADGRPKSGQQRWTIGSMSFHEFSLRDYLRALFTANSGHYRVIVFILSDVPFSQAKETVTSEQAGGWLRAGMNTLPASIGAKSYSSRHDCTVLIYEFDKEEGKAPQIDMSSALGARAHLQGSGVWRSLGGAQ